MVQSIGNNQYIPASEADIYTTVTSSGKSNTIWNSSISQCSSEDSNTSPSPADLQKNMQSPPPAPTRRNMGGRRPNREMNLPPEEEERRRVRRERNKAAAARCRKRRVDHTNQLLDETEELEKKKLELEKELSELQKCSEELEMLLENHRPCCKLQMNMHCPPSPPEEKPHAMHYETAGMQRVKTEMIESFHDDEYYVTPAKKIMLSSTVPIAKPSRPNFLNVGGASPFGMSGIAATNNNKAAGPFDDALAGIGITTPSTGMHFNFDSLMVGGTGLTPVSAPLVPNCSAQQRIPVSMSGDVISPEACVPPKLVSL